MDLQRALSDLEEVRDRLAHVQRFEGYSAPAAFASGIAALVAGYVQFSVAPLPASSAGLRAYVIIWMTCLAVALLLNYGAVAVWMLRHRTPGARSQLRTAARSIAPSVALGGALTVALLDHSAYTLLPGTWFGLYALGLFASRGALPAATLPVTFGFGALALVFLMTRFSADSLAWWVMPLGFGLGQLAIGTLIWRQRAA